MFQQWDSEPEEIFVVQGLLTVIGVLYASQMVRSSVRARVSFHHLDMLWSLEGCFAWCLFDLRDTEEIRWDKSGFSFLEMVFEIFTCWLVQMSLGIISPLQSLHHLLSSHVEVFVLPAFRRCLLFQYKELPPRLMFLIDERVKSVLVSALPETALHKMACPLFQTGFRFQCAFHDSLSLLNDEC